MILSQDELDNLIEFTKPPEPMAETVTYADVIPNEIKEELWDTLTNEQSLEKTSRTEN